VAEIVTIGFCIQLLSGASLLLQDQLERLTKLDALDSLQISAMDTY